MHAGSSQQQRHTVAVRAASPTPKPRSPTPPQRHTVGAAPSPSRRHRSSSPTWEDEQYSCGGSPNFNRLSANAAAPMLTQHHSWSKSNTSNPGQGGQLRTHSNSRQRQPSRGVEGVGRKVSQTQRISGSTTEGWSGGPGSGGGAESQGRKGGRHVSLMGQAAAFISGTL